MAPFSDFSKLSDSQHWYKPASNGLLTRPISTAVTTAATTDPDLVIFCAWAFAAPKHIAKYVTQYQQQYPQTEILLLQTSMANLVWKPDYIQFERLAPTIKSFKNFLLKWSRVTANNLPKTPKKQPTILAHAFSNGGAHSLIQFAQAYHKSTATPTITNSRVPHHLPLSALILDSSPGRGDFNIGVRVALAMTPKTATFARLIGYPIAYVTVAGIQVADYLGIAENIAHKTWRCLNAPEFPFLVQHLGLDDHKDEEGKDVKGLGLGVKVVQRTYICSDKDDMVPMSGVLEHAGEAKAVLANILAQEEGEEKNVDGVIRTEGFVGTMHVNHMAGDPERYWRIVKETLERV